MINSSPHIIDELVHYGVDFRREGSAFAFTREGAHSTPRILFHDDVTGREITSKLLEPVSYTHLLDAQMSRLTGRPMARA